MKQGKTKIWEEIAYVSSWLRGTQISKWCHAVPVSKPIPIFGWNDTMKILTDIQETRQGYVHRLKEKENKTLQCTSLGEDVTNTHANVSTEAFLPTKISTQAQVSNFLKVF